MILTKGGGQLVLEDVNSEGIRYLGGGVCYLISEAVEEVLVLRQEVQNFMELSMRTLHVRRGAGPSTLMRDMIC